MFFFAPWLSQAIGADPAFGGVLARLNGLTNSFRDTPELAAG
jgi:hypothetical protein